MREEGLAVELLETRHVRTAFKTMPVKTDRKDARGIAQLMRMGWFRPVHCTSVPAQEVWALLTTRKLVLNKRIDMEMGLRGILRGFGFKIGPTTPRTFETRVREMVEGHPTLHVVAEALLTARGALIGQLKAVEKRLVGLARDDTRVRWLMSTPGVGVIVALTYVSAIDDPARFKSSRAVRPQLGLTPGRYRSGETDVTGRISKTGDAGVRAALYEAANVILTRPMKGSTPTPVSADRSRLRPETGAPDAGDRQRHLLIRPAGDLTPSWRRRSGVAGRYCTEHRSHGG